jgi:predicted TIM-barrel fold metal-dependent hydrolase
MDRVQRRTFLAAAASIAAQSPPIPIIDTHIHLFDPTRLQGVPWPPRTNTLIYKPTLPDRYRALTAPYGVKGAIYVECSPWVEDNDWVLEVAEKDTIMVGVVGNLEPGKPDFRKHLARLRNNPLFLGIRYGYLWGRSLSTELPKPRFIADLKQFAAAGLELDTVGPNRIVEDVLRITDKVPNLRIVIDHLPHNDPPPDQSVLRELVKRPQVYLKISEVLRQVGDRVPHDLAFYRDRLDLFWDIFGPDRLFYGSDWPNSDPMGTYEQVLNVVREYVTAKGPAATEKFFWKNSQAAYRWIKRQAA